MSDSKNDKNYINQTNEDDDSKVEMIKNKNRGQTPELTKNMISLLAVNVRYRIEKKTGKGQEKTRHIKNINQTIVLE